MFNIINPHSNFDFVGKRKLWISISVIFIIGTIFLTVCLARAFAGQLTPKQHGGFEFAAWYWHFVDVVWLFLFSCIYVWGSWGVLEK